MFKLKCSVKNLVKIIYLIFIYSLCCINFVNGVNGQNEILYNGIDTVTETSNDDFDLHSTTINHHHHHQNNNDGGGQITELSGGQIVGERILHKYESPYLLRTDLEIERGAKLTIEPGVSIQFAPMVGITVRGSIYAVVSIYTHLYFNLYVCVVYLYLMKSYIWYNLITKILI